MLITDNFTTFLPIFLFQILFKVREKNESFEGFFSGRNIFSKPMLGSPNRLIRDIFEFSCLPLLAQIAAKICEPIREGRKIQKIS